MPRALRWCAVAAVLAAAGCGSDHPVATHTTQTVVTPAQSTTPAPASPLPHGIPQKGQGAADLRSRRVIRGWLTALRNGDIRRAAGYFAQPSKVQNGTPVLTLSSLLARVEFNAAFPCGAKVRKFRAAARGFTIVDFVLTERRNGDCMGAAGQLARGAIRVKGQRIAEWYRLADAPGGGTAPAPSPASGPGSDLI